MAEMVGNFREMHEFFPSYLIFFISYSVIFPLHEYFFELRPPQHPWSVRYSLSLFLHRSLLGGGYKWTKITIFRGLLFILNHIAKLILFRTEMFYIIRAKNL